MAPVRFTDPNFRLACLDVLLDNGHFETELQKILEIPEYECGGALHPERMKALAQLPIRQKHLDEIEESCPDGGDDVYEHVFPQWGGTDDDLYISSFADVKLLRRVEYITIHAVTHKGALDLSLLSSLKHLVEVDTDYYYVSPDSDIDAAVKELEGRGVDVSISGTRRNE